MQNVINKLAFNRDVKSDGIAFEDYFPERSDARYLMEATPFSYSQQAALSYAKDHPGARVIFMLRDPSKRLLSSFRFFQGMYQEFPVSTFDEFVNALLDIGGTREAYRARIPKPFFRSLFDSEVEMGYYARHIRRWTTVLGPEQVYVGTMERLRDEANTVMAEICTFLELPSTCYDDYEFKPFMQSYKVKYSWAQKIGRKFGKEDPMRFDRISQFQNPFHRIPWKALRLRLEAAYKHIQHEEKKENFSVSMTLLDNVYRSANVELAKEFGIDYTKGAYLQDFLGQRPAAE